MALEHMKEDIFHTEHFDPAISDIFLHKIYSDISCELFTYKSPCRVFGSSLFTNL